MASLAHSLSTNSQLSPYRRTSPARLRPGIIPRARALVRLWGQRMHERTELARLDDRDLRDIGLSRADVARILAKPFWRM